MSDFILDNLSLFLIPQKLKDWQLLLMATGIIAVEVIYTIPLLVLIHHNGDTEIVINEDNPPFTNVSLSMIHSIIKM